MEGKMSNSIKEIMFFPRKQNINKKKCKQPFLSIKRGVYISIQLSGCAKSGAICIFPYISSLHESV
jgi:hypothetical protein